MAVVLLFLGVLALVLINGHVVVEGGSYRGGLHGRILPALP